MQLFRIENLVETTTKPLSEHYVLCSYHLRPEVTCEMPASSLVVDSSNGNRLYRCSAHQGLVRGDQGGEVLHELTRKLYIRKIYARPAIVNLLRGYALEAMQNHGFIRRLYRALMWAYDARKTQYRILRLRKSMSGWNHQKPAITLKVAGYYDRN
jgi:hypothetical protein